ncbi:heavy-metal-associated domain-containing protein [Moraxella nasovis]|uniref:heavy-metal-associated domain-containing protein n=1 Tax=Moraxella nasovis TaxID=2904121 RepID=UPI001F613E6F|nr:heavy-metal-associated domain-containing protein [Moraxella nasovis]UNU73195.1 heavy-metal-associated domain-containing protein [Moraxella nasovis]
MIDTLTLRVEGMTCDGCVSSVYNAINELAGVKNVDVNLPLKTAVIDYDDTQLDKIELINAVEEAGFSVTP